MKLERITLVRPNMGDYRASDAMPPLVMGVLAARVPKDVEVRFYDDRVEEIPLDEPTNLAAISVETFTARRAYHLAGSYRARGIPVVMGGHHPTLLPDEALRHADSVVIGDAEGVWEELLDDFRHGSLKNLYYGKSVDERSFAECGVKYEIFEGKKYARVNLVQYGRGCRHHCDFCSVHAFYGKTRWHRPAAAVAGEIAGLRRPQLPLFFVDDNLYSSTESLRELLEAIRPLGIKWACQISADVIKAPGIMDLMATSGCCVAIIGFESISGENLKAMKKDWSGAAHLDVIREFHSRGIAICGTFIFGYDGDTAETINETVNFVKKTRLEMALLSPLTPLPGTPFYDRLKLEGRLLRPEWWLDGEYRYGDAIIAPSGMSPEEFSRLCFNAKKSFYSWGAIAKRVFAPGSGFSLWKIGLFGTANLISRREVYRKQFSAIGK